MGHAPRIALLAAVAGSLFLLLAGPAWPGERPDRATCDADHERWLAMIESERERAVAALRLRLDEEPGAPARDELSSAIENAFDNEELDRNQVHVAWRDCVAYARQ